MPMMRPLWLTNPDDPEAARIGDEYLWGPDLLVAPVVEKGATKRHLYLPKGDWYDWWTNEKVTGGRWLDRPVDLKITPLYVRAGAVLPLDPVRQYTSQKVSDPTTLVLHPGADGAFTLYDDDGHTMAYASDNDPSAVWINFTWNDAAKKLTISPDPRMKQWPGNARLYQIQIPGKNDPPKRIDWALLPAAFRQDVDKLQGCPACFQIDRCRQGLAADLDPRPC